MYLYQSQSLHAGYTWDSLRFLGVLSCCALTCASLQLLGRYQTFATGFFRFLFHSANLVNLMNVVNLMDLVNLVILLNLLILVSIW